MAWLAHTQNSKGGNYRRAERDNDAPVSRPVDRIAEVHVDGLVILKIIKHCRDSFPENVAGSLLGFEKDDNHGNLTGVLEVTHCFPAPTPDEELDNGPQDSRYEVRMMKALKEVHIDQSSIGWYSSFYLSSFYTPDTVAHQARYQSSVPGAVLLVYDNVRTAQGHLALRALRLSDAAMSAYRLALADIGRSGKGNNDPERIDKLVASHEAFSGLPPSQLFEDVPLKIRNPHFLQALLVDLVDTAGMTASAITSSTTGTTSIVEHGTIGGAAVAGATASTTASITGNTPAPLAEDTDFARLDLSTVSYLEKHLEMLNEFMSDMSKVQDNQATFAKRALRMQREREEWINRRRRENEDRIASGLQPLPEEDHSLPFFQMNKGSGHKEPLEVQLMSAQITNYCHNVTKFAHQNFGKLFLTQTMASKATTTDA